MDEFVAGTDLGPRFVGLGPKMSLCYVGVQPGPATVFKSLTLMDSLLFRLIVRDC